MFMRVVGVSWISLCGLVLSGFATIPLTRAAGVPPLTSISVGGAADVLTVDRGEGGNAV